MKMPIEWHEQCLNNQLQTLETARDNWEREKVLRQDQIDSLARDSSEYKRQIEAAQDEGRTAFDRDRFGKSRALKVWGGRYCSGPKNERMIVAAYTAKQARELGDVSETEMKNFWSLTGNIRELRVATTPGVWIVHNSGRTDESFERMK